MKPLRSPFPWIVITILWLGCVAAGFDLLAREQFTAVPTTTPSRDFPRGSTLALEANRPTLIVFLHPECPCSRATLHELAGILDQTHGHLNVEVIFTIAEGTPSGWEKGELWTASHAMTGVSVSTDPGGRTARAFHVVGSGHALLYDAGGHLLFSGGITSSRGEEGANVGEAAVVDLVLHDHSDVQETPVFGCSLL